MSGNGNSPERKYFDRLVALEREKQGLLADIKEVYQEAKGDPEFTGEIKTLRKAVKLAVEDEEKADERRRVETEARNLLESLGVLRGTPLGEAAVAAAK